MDKHDYNHGHDDAKIRQSQKNKLPNYRNSTGYRHHRVEEERGLYGTFSSWWRAKTKKMSNFVCRITSATCFVTYASGIVNGNVFSGM